ncbi:hypothetical protein AVEN_27646-1, partial [Araneus ventricosus]
METKYELIETHTEQSNGNSLKRSRAAQQNENEESRETNSLLTENDEQIQFMPTFKEKKENIASSLPTPPPTHILRIILIL